MTDNSTIERQPHEDTVGNGNYSTLTDMKISYSASRLVIIPMNQTSK